MPVMNSTIFDRIPSELLSNKRYYLTLFLSVIGSSYFMKSVWKALVVPKHLRHIPKVSTIPWLLSILRGDSHDVRVKKLMLPLMNQHGLCLKYIMGRWVLTVGDPRLLQLLLKDVYTYPKEQVTMDP
ncbi:MAG: hypothetical protein EXX96DRAFT_75205, partial [Benjaminiella poitrasii]